MIRRFTLRRFIRIYKISLLPFIYGSILVDLVKLVEKKPVSTKFIVVDIVFIIVLLVIDMIDVTTEKDLTK